MWAYSHICRRRSSRQQYIRRILGADINFQHRKKPYVYKTFNPAATEYVMGVIGKEHSISVGSSPKESFRAQICTRLADGQRFH